MTPLLTPITRSFDLGRGIVHITLDPKGGGMLLFREKGRHVEYPLFLPALFAQAVGRFTDSQRADKRAHRIARRTALG